MPRGDGPIGRTWPARHAAARGLSLTADPDGGLISDLDAVAHAGPFHPHVRAFYERTARFDLSLGVRWRWGAWVGGAIWARLFGRRWRQLELPTVADVALTNEIFALADDRGTLWLRRYAGTDRALYISRYDVARVPGEPEPAVRITFPVPGGAWVVVFRVEPHADGGVLLTEAGGEPGGAGLYLVPTGAPPRYVRALRETIAVWPTEDGVDALHTFDLWGVRLLELRYGTTLPTADRVVG